MEIKKEEEVKAEAPATEAVPAEEKKEGDTEVKKEDSIDYKAELDKLSKRLNQAEYVITEKDKALRSLKKSKTDSEDEEEENVINQDVIKETVSKELEAFKQQQAQSFIEAELLSITNVDERELTKQHYLNTINRTGFTPERIKEDISTARFLANKAKYESRLSEMKNAFTANATVSKDGDISSQEGGNAQKPVDLKPHELELLKRAGLKPEDVGKDISQLLNKK
jgi:hypothetical protein